MKKILIALVAFAMSSVAMKAETANVLERQNTTSTTYTVDNTTIFPNPERGFIDQLEKVVSASSPYCVKGNEWYFEESDRANERLVLVLYYFDNFKTSDLPAALINAFDEDMAVLRNNGYKCILRYAYCSSNNTDASKAQVLRHINQLKAKWVANKDVIYVFQAGFIGQWGEWYYTSNFTNKTSNMTADRKEVVDALLSALPSDMYIQLRTPFQKTQYLNSTSPLSASEAFSGTAKARLGHHNDAFLNGAQNQGTYTDTATQKPYLAQETLYVPIGGETNIESSSSVNTYATYSKTTGEMSRLHWSFCKGSWPEVTMNAWQANGTYDELNRKMGYRYQLVSGTYTNTANPGGTLQVAMSLKNVGYAPLYNERTAYIVLKNNSNTYSLPLTSDPRRWLPNGVTTTVNEALALPADIAAGTYQLYLYLPDVHSSIAADPRYAVRFANTGTWESATGYNNLNASLTISGSAVVEPTSSVTLPATLNKDNNPVLGNGATWYEAEYIDLNHTCEAHPSDYVEWQVSLVTPGVYTVSETGHYENGHQYRLELRKDDSVVSYFDTEATWSSSTAEDLTFAQTATWDLTTIPAGLYTLRVHDVLSVGWSEPKLKSVTLSLCRYPTGIEDDAQFTNSQCTKFLRDGRLYIRHGSTLYDAEGRKLP